jgi:hypothetical protein
LFTSEPGSVRSSRFKESRASYSKLRSRPSNTEWNCASNGLINRSELGATTKEPFNTFKPFKSLKAFIEGEINSIRA